MPSTSPGGPTCQRTVTRVRVGVRVARGRERVRWRERTKRWWLVKLGLAHSHSDRATVLGEFKAKPPPERRSLREP